MQTEPTPAGVKIAEALASLRDAHHIIAGNWPALMAQCSPADLRPVRVRGERRERSRLAASA